MNDNWRNEQIRQEALDQQRRAQELATEAGKEMWRYWNDPVSGFWAIMRRQDEQFDRQRQDMLADLQRQQEEYFLRSQEYSRSRPEKFDDSWLGEVNTSIQTPTSERYDRLIDASNEKIDYPASYQNNSYEQNVSAERDTDPRVGNYDADRGGNPTSMSQDENRNRREQPPVENVGDSTWTLKLSSEERRESLIDAYATDQRVTDPSCDEPRHTESDPYPREHSDQQQSEASREYNREQWLYWWDPVGGFWATMRRQDEARDDAYREMVRQLEEAQWRYLQDNAPQPSENASSEAWKAFLSTLPVEEHHIASNKSKDGPWSDMARDIIEPFGLSLDDDWNKIRIPHRGRHVFEYHQYVIGTMAYIADQVVEETKQRRIAAEDTLKFQQERFKELFKELIADTVAESPEMLRKKSWFR